MSKSEILEELPKLTPQERQEVRLRLAELDGDDWLDPGALTEREKALIEERFHDLEANPKASVPWEEAKSRLLVMNHWTAPERIGLRPLAAAQDQTVVPGLSAAALEFETE
jgi:hypothetical protein